VRRSTSARWCARCRTGSSDWARSRLWNLIQNPLDTTIAGASLIFGGVLERHLGLTICLAHGGGFLAYNLGRLTRGRLVRSETGVAMAGFVEEPFGRLYFDTITHASSALRLLVEEATAEHVLLGTDFPFDMADPRPLETVRQADLSDQGRALIVRGNAECLLKLVPVDERGGR